MQKIVHLCRKERPIHGFVLSRPPVFSPLTHPQIFSRERPLDAIFNKLTMPSCMPTSLLQPSYVPGRHGLKEAFERQVLNGCRVDQWLYLRKDSLTDEDLSSLGCVA